MEIRRSPVEHRSNPLEFELNPRSENTPGSCGCRLLPALSLSGSPAFHINSLFFHAREKRFFSPSPSLSLFFIHRGGRQFSATTEVLDFCRFDDFLLPFEGEFDRFDWMVDRGKKERVFFRRTRRFIILDGELTLVERVFIKLPWITFVLAGFSLLGESIFNQVLIPRSILISSLRYCIINVYVRT